MVEPEPTFTLADLASRLDVPPHRLIHLCEKRVVIPDVQDATGRGTSRIFSARNVLELALALRLRDMMLPVSAAGPIIHVLRTLEEKLREDAPSFSLVGSLRAAHPPELKAIISDGRTIYFTLGMAGAGSTLFGGVPIDANGQTGIRVAKARGETNAFGGPEGSRFGRTELSVTAVAQALPIS